MGRGRARQTIELRERAKSILTEIRPATVRAVCYRLFSEGAIPNMSKRETSRISRMLTNAREDGELKWDWIVDNTRKPTWPGTYASLMSFGRSVPTWWRQDPWEYQALRIEVWSEKDTVSGVLAPVLGKFAIPFRVNRGFTSATAAHDIAEETASDDKPLIAFYVCDYDPSGLYMSAVDLPQRLAKYDVAVGFELRRIALVESDLPALGTLSFAASEKARDPRYRWYLKHSGRTRCFELDALNPNDLRERVRSAILAEVNPEAWARVEVCDRAVRQSLDAYTARWVRSKRISHLGKKYDGECQH
jgi:hypothetical protein